jgi:hypothetical protein
MSEQLNPTALATKLRQRAGSRERLSPTPTLATNPLGSLRQMYKIVSAGIAIVANGSDSTHYHFTAADAPAVLQVGDLLSAECVRWPVLSNLRFESRPEQKQ